MGWVMAKIYDRFMRASEEACLQAWRGELLASVTGDVLEIGAGTGANLAHYDRALGRLVLAEPDPRMRVQCEAKLALDRRPNVEVCGADASALPFGDATFDVVVSTLVLCSVPDQARVIAEVRRVLKPGGKLVFLEHVAAEGDPMRLLWQRAIEPVWKHLAGNCHVTRDTAKSIRDAGFTLEGETRASMRKAMRHIRPTVRGVAIKAT
jgi:ubiquinone/menaquinone biosynthesis C-methylase UbiE